MVASFPVEDSDQMMLVTNGGKIIRSPVADIRIAGRSTQGVTLFDTADDEKVVSVAHLKETEENPEGEKVNVGKTDEIDAEISAGVDEVEGTRGEVDDSAEGA